MMSRSNSCGAVNHRALIERRRLASKHREASFCYTAGHNDNPAIQALPKDMELDDASITGRVAAWR